MKRFFALFVTAVLCFALTLPVFAADDSVFVPSISYKDGPGIDETDLETDCLVVTSIRQAEAKSTDIYQEDRDLLLSVYKQLADSSMQLPLEDKTYVIRELVDVSFKKTDCQEKDHGHKAWLAEDNTTVSVVFDLGVKETTDVTVLVYVNEQWTPVESVENLGGGKVRVVFEDLCPVAFCVAPDAEEEAPGTGDAAGQNLLLWIVLMVVSLAAVVVLMVNRRRITR